MYMSRSLQYRGVLAMAFVGLIGVASPALAAQPDAFITTKAKLALMTTEGIDSGGINVDTMDGAVTLHGKVKTEKERAMAEALAKAIDGVSRVRNLLVVVPENAEKRVEKADDKIKDEVQKLFKADKSLADSSISVKSVNKGVVLLSGKADTLTDYLRAVEDAASVAGVRRVASEIKSADKLAETRIWRDRERTDVSKEPLSSDTASDTWTTTQVKMRLIANAQVPARDVNVDTRNGHVTLFGVVPNDKAKEAASLEAQKVVTVAGVRNMLQVVPEAKQEQVEAKDDAIGKEVKSALKAQDGLGDVNFEVKNGVVRLTGNVPSGWYRLRAASCARGVKGVKSVQDDLRVEKPRG
jgi:hyperosmotically inducible periplasmic protein